jgi:hypothetical protein
MPPLGQRKYLRIVYRRSVPRMGCNNFSAHSFNVVSVPDESAKSVSWVLDRCQALLFGESPQSQVHDFL